MPATTRHQLAAPDELALRDGRAARIRPIGPDDADGLVEFFGRCTDLSRYLRFHSWKQRLRTSEAHYLAGSDGRQRIALVASVLESGHERIVADVRLEPLDDGDAEAALIVRDDLQGCGLGGALLARLLAEAAAAGWRRLILEILPENRAMVELAGRFGATPLSTDGRSVRFALPVTRRPSSGG
jgi:GNAT superfamily N-acetyltransferase